MPSSEMLGHNYARAEHMQGRGQTSSTASEGLSGLGVLVGLQCWWGCGGTGKISWTKSSKCNPSSFLFLTLGWNLKPFKAEFTVPVPVIWCLKEITEFHEITGNGGCLPLDFYKSQASSFWCMDGCSKSCDAVIRSMSFYSVLDSSLLACLPRKIKPKPTKFYYSKTTHNFSDELNTNKGRSNSDLEEPHTHLSVCQRSLWQPFHR